MRQLTARVLATISVFALAGCIDRDERELQDGNREYEAFCLENDCSGYPEGYGVVEMRDGVRYYVELARSYSGRLNHSPRDGDYFYYKVVDGDGSISEYSLSRRIRRYFLFECCDRLRDILAMSPDPYADVGWVTLEDRAVYSYRAPEPGQTRYLRYAYELLGEDHGTVPDGLPVFDETWLALAEPDAGYAPYVAVGFDVDPSGRGTSRFPILALVSREPMLFGKQVLLACRDVCEAGLIGTETRTFPPLISAKAVAMIGPDACDDPDPAAHLHCDAYIEPSELFARRFEDIPKRLATLEETLTHYMTHPDERQDTER